MHNVKVLVKGKPRCTMHLHPDDAAALGLADGDPAVVRSRVGQVTVPVEVTDAIRPGVVSIPHGWGHDLDGHPAGGGPEHAGVNSNLLADETLFDAISGNAVLNGIPVEVAAAPEPALAPSRLRAGSLAQAAPGFTASRRLRRRCGEWSSSAGESAPSSTSVEVVDVDGQRAADPGLAGLGEHGVGAAAIRWAGLPLHEAGALEPVDGPGEPAGGERGLGGQVAHAQAVARGADEAQRAPRTTAPDGRLDRPAAARRWRRARRGPRRTGRWS